MDMGWISHLIIFFIILFSPHTSYAEKLESHEVILINRNYKNFYQDFSSEKTQEENNLFSKYSSQWRKAKDRKQRAYNYLGLIEFELTRKNIDSALKLLKKMPPGLKYFTLEQKNIYDILRAQLFFEKKDYARTVLILKNLSSDAKNIYFNKTSVLYMKSLINLDLKFEAID